MEPGLELSGLGALLRLRSLRQQGLRYQRVACAAWPKLVSLDNARQSALRAVSSKWQNPATRRVRGLRPAPTGWIVTPSGPAEEQKSSD